MQLSWEGTRRWLSEVWREKYLPTSSNSFHPFPREEEKKLRKNGGERETSKMVVDYYSVLDVSTTATDEEVRKAYKTLARKWHPDKNPNPNSEAKFKQIYEAYSILSDPRARQLHDLRRADALDPPSHAPADTSGGGEGAGAAALAPSHARADTSGGGGGAGAAEYKLMCSLEELYSGYSRKMKVSREVFDAHGYMPLSLFAFAFAFPNFIVFAVFVLVVL